LKRRKKRNRKRAQDREAPHKKTTGVKYIQPTLGIVLSSAEYRSNI